MSRTIPAHLAEIIQELELERPTLVTTNKIRELIDKFDATIPETRRSRSLGVFTGRTSPGIFHRGSISTP
jgi:hypothetical protein